MAGFRFGVTAEEWDLVGRFVYPSALPDEHAVTGHFLVELRGGTRRWVATDGAQLAVLTVDGEPATAVADDGSAGDGSAGGPVLEADVLVNPRLLRGQPPVDCVIEVDEDDSGRVITVDADGIRSALPEHPGEFPDRAEVLASVEERRGARLRIGRLDLFRALSPAMVRPTGSSDEEHPPVMLGVIDGELVLTVEWQDLPATRVSAPVVDHDGVARVWVNPERLWSLVGELEDDDVSLVLPGDELGPVLVETPSYQAVLMALDRLGVARDRLESLLCAYLGLDEVVRDDDGDYPVRERDGVVYFVRLDHPDLPTVRVFAVIADEVEPSVELLRELNDINAASPQLKAILVEGSVMAEIELMANTLDREELEVALDRITGAVRQYQPLLEGFFAAAPPAADD